MSIARNPKSSVGSASILFKFYCVSVFSHSIFCVEVQGMGWNGMSLLARSLARSSSKGKHLLNNVEW